ncbi:hypothetical protein LTR56_000480 [Elasticomyces elasticus]|nr:hypothetical protein LTR22_014208 [Elasticomyces elasticus]KAK3660722.1 hypothetical protein LTR56_000480 [Elasticomyces elasticus]KAK4922868.1 hypothetical protein LTR49_009875 [Elasticomyces elasticus]KAK5759756.1 hypothetical protein LTS12_010096 [Elasticomyces elasticus]
MAEQLVQEYLDRAQAAEQTVLQLKIELNTSRIDHRFELQSALHRGDSYFLDIKRLKKELAAAQDNISVLEEAIDVMKEIHGGYGPYVPSGPKRQRQAAAASEPSRREMGIVTQAGLSTKGQKTEVEGSGDKSKRAYRPPGAR